MNDQPKKKSFPERNNWPQNRFQHSTEAKKAGLKCENKECPFYKKRHNCEVCTNTQTAKTPNEMKLHRTLREKGIFQEGQEAFNKCTPRSLNPYSEISDRTEWNNGWDECWEQQQTAKTASKEKPGCTCLERHLESLKRQRLQIQEEINGLNEVMLDYSNRKDYFEKYEQIGRVWCDRKPLITELGKINDSIAYIEKGK
jgi:ribosome modulation factor